MKRFFIAVALTAAVCGAAAVTPHRAVAAKPSPTASPTVAPLPTASPEPPNIAIPRLIQKLKDNPNDRRAMTDLANEYMQIGHPEAAVPITQRLLQLGTKTAEVYFLDGTAQESLGNAQAALVDMEAASNLEPTNLSVLSTLADLYIKTGRRADAERIANRAVTFNKDQAQAYVALAGVYAAEQKWDDARAQLEKAYSLDTKNVTPLIQEAQTWVAQNTIPNALGVIDRAIAADPKNVQVLVLRAELFARENDTAKSASAFDDAVAAAANDDEKAAILVRKASMYAAARKNVEARATFDAAVKAYPNISAIHTAYGEYFRDALRDRGSAEREFLSAIRVNKADVTAIIDMAQLKQSQGRTSDAISYLKQWSDVAPSARAYAVLGQAYVSTHQYDRAKDACTRSFEMQRDPDTLGCVAGSDYSLKNYKEAAQIFTVIDNGARGYMDRNPQLLFMAGDSYSRLNQPAKAADSFKRLLRLMKPGTKTYKDIQARVASLSKTKPSGKKTKHG